MTPRKSMYHRHYNMIARCTKEHHTAYKNYGARGISVCTRWLESLDNFIEDMGYPEPGMTLDRIDVNGNYEPSNCRWTDWSTQNKNQRQRPTRTGERNIGLEYGRYAVKIKRNGKKKWYGSYATLEEAKVVRDKITKELECMG